MKKDDGVKLWNLETCQVYKAELSNLSLFAKQACRRCLDFYKVD